MNRSAVNWGLTAIGKHGQAIGKKLSEPETLAPIRLPRMLVSGEHYFPSGKLFKLTLVLEPFRMRFEVGDPASLV